MWVGFILREGRKKQNKFNQSALSYQRAKFCLSIFINLPISHVSIEMHGFFHLLLTFRARASALDFGIAQAILAECSIGFR